MSPKSTYHHGDLKNALIQAGIDILAQKGIQALSLRRVARKAGVSHAAPYAHFADKQALIAAIATRGYERLYEKVHDAAQRYRPHPLRQLVESSWAYVEFALSDPAHFKTTLSGVVEKEQDYPAFVEISTKSFALVVEIVQACQQAGILHPGPPDLLAATLWAQVHGFVSLILENQISHTVLERYSLKEMLLFALNQITVAEIDPAAFAQDDSPISLPSE